LSENSSFRQLCISPPPKKKGAPRENGLKILIYTSKRCFFTKYSLFRRKPAFSDKLLDLMWGSAVTMLRCFGAFEVGKLFFLLLIG